MFAILNNERGDMSLLGPFFKSNPYFKVIETKRKNNYRIEYEIYYSLIKKHSFQFEYDSTYIKE